MPVDPRFLSKVVLFAVACAVVVSPAVAATGLLQFGASSETPRMDGAAASTLDVDPSKTAPRGAQAATQASSESEPNDDFANADVIQPGVPVDGSVASTSDLDVFAVSADAATTLTVDFARGPADGTLGVAVFDAQGNFVSGQFVSPDNRTSFDAAAPGAGTYYVVVASGSQFSNETGLEGTGPYTLEVNTGDTGTDPGGASESEPNDDGSNANPLQAGVPLQGTVASVDDLDFYTVDVSEPGTLSVELSPQGSGTLVAAVYDPQGNYLDGYFVEAGDTFEFPVQASQAGRYWVLVTSGSQFTTGDGSAGPEGAGPYTLQVRTDGTGDGGQPTPTPGDTAPTPGGFETPTPGGNFATPTPESGFGTPTPGDGFATPTPRDGGPASEVEPNDAPQQANLVQFGASTAGAVESPDDKDWYAFDANAGQSLNATLTRGDGDGTFRVLYYFANGSLFAEVDSIAPNSRGTLLTTAPTTGRYYVRVASPDGSGTYAFSVAPQAGGGQGIVGPGPNVGPDVPGENGDDDGNETEDGSPPTGSDDPEAVASADGNARQNRIAHSHAVDRAHALVRDPR